jgi:hypothetical protein
MHERNKNCVKKIKGIPGGKRPRGTSRSRWKISEWILEKRGVNWIIFTQNHSNEPSGSVKGREFLY